MKRKILIAGLFLGGVAASNLSAQKYLGLSNSNYSGVYGSQYNPAKLTDEKVKVAVNLVSVNGLVNNDYYKFKNLNSFGGFTLDELGNGASHNGGNGALINLGIVGEVLGPSFQFTVNNKLGFGFSSRVRLFGQGKNINSAFLDALNGNLGTDNPGLANIPLVDNTGFGINTTALTDLGVKGAYAVIDNNDLKLSLGASVKLYKGAGLNRFESNGHNLIYNNNPSNPTISATNINWDLYTNLNPEKSLNDYGFGDFFGGATGFGGDFGAELTLKEASGDKPYFLKFGASVNDIGAIKYNDIRRLSIRGAGSAIDPAKIDIFDLNAIDYLIRKEGVGHAVGAFLDLVSSPLQGGENRAEAIKAIAYIAFTGNLPKRKAEILKEELFVFLSLDRYEKYKELQVAPDLPSYKLLLEPMLSFVVEVNPQWISSIIHDLSQAGSVSPGGCIYSIEELSKLLSDHQRS